MFAEHFYCFKQMDMSEDIKDKYTTELYIL